MTGADPLTTFCIIIEMATMKYSPDSGGPGYLNFWHPGESQGLSYVNFYSSVLETRKQIKTFQLLVP